MIDDQIYFVAPGKYDILSFVFLVATLPHYRPACRLGLLGNLTSDPLQGAGYFFLVSNLICYIHELRLFEMSLFDAQVGGETKCARIKAAAEEEMAKLLSAYRTRACFFASAPFFSADANPGPSTSWRFTGQARAASAPLDDQDSGWLAGLGPERPAGGELADGRTCGFKVMFKIVFDKITFKGNFKKLCLKLFLKSV